MESRIIEWNGKELPDGLRALPPGRYLIESLDDHDQPGPAQDAELRTALNDLDDGHHISLEDAVGIVLDRKQTRGLRSTE